MTVRSLRTLLAAATATAGLLAATPQASADAAADFYKGKTITIIVGFSPGGGADTFARFFAPHFSDFMPGHPSVIVQNMPGAGGIKALNHLYNIAPKDGTQVMLASPSHTIAYLLGRKNVRYDMNKIRWVGTLTQDVPSCVASGRSGFTSIVQARKRQLIVGATGKSSSTTQHVLLLKNMFGYNIKIVEGYRGTSRVRLAMKKGEVQAVCAFWASAALGPQHQEVMSGELVPIVQLGEKPVPIFGKAPVVYSLARNEDERKIMHAVYGTTELSRPMAAPPGTPDMQMEGLRRGFWAAVNSPALKKHASRMKLIINPLDWKGTEQKLKEILATPKPLIARTKKLLGQK